MSSAFQNDRLQEEFDRFIEFGNLLDRQSRKYLVQYLQSQITDQAFELPELLNDQYFLYFKKSLDDLFRIKELLPILQRNERITEQVLLDTLYWVRKTYDKVKTKNPYESEKDRLENYAVTPLHVFVKRWQIPLHFLRQHYSRDQIDLDFYQDRFQRLIGNRAIEEIEEPQRQRLEMILTDLLSQWDALLSAKILDYQLQRLAEEQEIFQQLMEAKVSEYTRLMDLVSPFSDYLGWDMSRELWEDRSFDVLQEYDELLQDEASIKALANLLGRMREAEIEIEEETFEQTIIRQEWKTERIPPSEITGIHPSDDLNNLLSSEAGLLGDPQTEGLFLQRFAEKQLQTFRYEDKQLVPSEDKFTDVHQRVRQKEKGPFIVCVDTSESMVGRPEQLAKVLTLGVLKMAIRENRRAYLINFSIGIKTLDLYDVANSVDELAKFLRMSFHGGTDISLPLYESIRQLKSQNYRDADVLVVSDFIMYRVDRDVLAEVKYHQQNSGTQFHSLTLSDDPNVQILEQFDTNWIYNPQQKGVIRELTRGLETIRERY